MRRDEKLFGLAGIAFILVWVLSLLASLAGTGLILYILWRVATHPW